MRGILWAEMTREDLKAALGQDPVVIVPVGAIEQHGPHLPVDTDANGVYELAVRAATAQSGVIVAPPIWWGYSHNHRAWPGLITLSSETLIQVVQDICLSIHQQGFRRIIVLNGHGGNRAPLGVAGNDLAAKHGCRVVLVTIFDLIADTARRIRRSRLGGMGHACELETSLQLHLRPHLVGEIPEANYVYERRKSQFLARDMFSGGKAVAVADESAEVGLSGVWGDPKAATAEEGEQLMDVATKLLGELIQEYRSGNLGL